MLDLTTNYIYYNSMMSLAKTKEEYLSLLKERNWYLNELKRYGHCTLHLPTSPVILLNEVIS